jgi:C-terminal processing protease CtpA/Prc
MAVIIGSVTKAAKADKVGIAFTQATKEAPLIIKLIREESLFSHTELQAGLLVISVNGVDIAGQTAKEAADLLREAEGEVTVVAAIVKKGVVAMAVKEMADHAVGISMKKNPTTGVIEISQIVDGGLFDETGLGPGQAVVAVNGLPCPATTKEAIMMIKDTVGKLSIVAEDVEVVEEPVEEAPMDVDVPADAPLDVPSTEGKEADQATASTTEDDAKDPADPDDPDADVVAKEEEADKREEAEKNGFMESLLATCSC